jgi:hypothetical protein
VEHLEGSWEEEDVTVCLPFSFSVTMFSEVGWGGVGWGGVGWGGVDKGGGMT